MNPRPFTWKIPEVECTLTVGVTHSKLGQHLSFPEDNYHFHEPILYLSPSSVLSGYAFLHFQQRLKHEIKMKKTLKK